MGRREERLRQTEGSRRWKNGLADRGGGPDRRASRRAMLVALGISGVFFVVEGVAGYLTNSLALLADAGHVLTDLGALLLALMAFWAAARPPSDARTYGYHRLEVLAALANGLAVWGVAAYIGLEGYRRLLAPPQVMAVPMLAVAIAGLAGNVAAALVLRPSAQCSLNARGAFVHVTTDAVQSVGVVLAGALMVAFGWYLADPIISLLTAILIAYSGSRVAYAAVHILLEGTPSHVNPSALMRRMEAVPQVQMVHDLHTWTITSGYHAMSAHVVVGSEATHDDEQLVLARLRDVAAREFGITHATIQLEHPGLLCQEAHAPASTEQRPS
ncbi:MAG: cation transporter [Chloroflexi bacterium]|nr:cation transporter [Chloroflexota bacterium]